MILSNLEIIVTGGLGDIGNFIANKLADESKKVIVIDHKINGERNNNSLIDFVQCDLTDPDKTEETIKKINDNYSDLNILINCAGKIFNSPLINFLSKDDRKHSFQAWDEIIKSNLYTCFNSTSSFAEKMVLKRKKALIINVSSIAAKGNMGQTAYSAAKAGVESITKVWAKELGMFGIRVVCLAPGFFDTASTKESLSDNVIEKYKSSIPLKRFGELDEIYTAIKFIIENDYLTGTSINLDGGLVI